MPDTYEKITMEHVERFLHSFKGKNSTKNNVLYRIRSFCGYAENYLGLPNPAAKIKPFKVTFYKQKCLTSAEYEKILAVCKVPLEAAVIRFLANSGLRRSEFRTLTPDHISADKTFMKICGKGGKLRTVPINAVCKDALSHIDLTKSYKKPESLMALCRKLSRKSGVIHTPHSYRHFFCTRLLKAQPPVPIAIVSRVMGHSSPVVTLKVYCHILVPDILGSTDVLDF